MTSTFHLEPMVLELYVDGRLSFEEVASVEAHLLSCGACRDALTPAAARARLDAIWSEVVEETLSPPPTRIERLLTMCGLRESTARLLAVTPSLRLAWFTAVAIVLAFAVIAADSGPRGMLWFLIVAPLLPVAGVAMAYGPIADPAHELTIAAPYDRVRLALIRSSAVVASCIAVTGIASLLLPYHTWAVAWLLPALALSAASLAIGTRIDPLVAAAVITVGWIATVTTSARQSDDLFAAFRVTGQLGCVLLLIVSAIAYVFLSRKDPLEEAPQ